MLNGVGGCSTDSLTHNTAGAHNAGCAEGYVRCADVTSCEHKVINVLGVESAKRYAVRLGQTALLEALEPYRAVQIRLNNGRNADRWCYQLRKDGEDQWPFVAPFQPVPVPGSAELRGDDGVIRGKKLEITYPVKSKNAQTIAEYEKEIIELK